MNKKIAILLFCLICLSNFSFANEDNHSFENEKKNETGKELKLESSQIIKPIPAVPSSNDVVSEEVIKMKETGVSTAEEFLFNPNLIATTSRDPNEYPVVSESAFYRNPSLVCPSRPKPLWEGTPKRLICKKGLTDSNINLKISLEDEDGSYKRQTKIKK